jgi:hypothetical protein
MMSARIMMTSVGRCIWVARSCGGDTLSMFEEGVDVLDVIFILLKP